MEVNISNNTKPILLEKHAKQFTPQYVKDCHACACTKPVNKKPENIMTSRIPRQLCEVLSIDIMGQYPKTAREKTR